MGQHLCFDTVTQRSWAAHPAEFLSNCPFLHLSFQPHDEQILPCKFPQQTVPAPLHPGLRGEQGRYVGSLVSLEASMLSAFTVLFLAHLVF